jgi:hypothetical protein
MRAASWARAGSSAALLRNTVKAGQQAVGQRHDVQARGTFRILAPGLDQRGDAPAVAVSGIEDRVAFAALPEAGGVHTAPA